MPYAATGTERPRPDLADTLYDYDLQANMNGMVALEVFPTFDAEEYKGDFPRVTAKQLMKRPTTATSSKPGKAFLRATRSAYATEETSFTKDDFETEEYGLEGFKDDREAKQYRHYFEYESFITTFIQNQLLTQLEERVANACFDTTVFTTAANRAVVLAAGDKWSAYGTADPVKKVRDGKIAVWNNSGIWPDSIIMNQHAFEHLKECDDIRSRVHSQGAGSPDRNTAITKQIIGQILGLENVIVAGSAYDGANPTATTFQPANIWGNHALIFKRARTRNLREVCLGRSFHWAIDDSMPNGYVEDYRDPITRSMKIRVRHQMDNKRLYASVGYLLQGVL